MPLEEIQKQFSIRYYHWAKDQLQKEVESDFAILRTISPCKALIDFFRELSDREQFTAISAFAKRGHPEAARLLGDSMTKQESELLEKYLKFVGWRIMMYDPTEPGLAIRSFDRNAFTKTVEAEIGPILGLVIEKGGRRYRRYLREFKAFRIETTVFTGGPTPRLVYDHRLLAPEGVICEMFSILSWLGIVNGTTDWKHIRNETSEAVIKACKKACSTFMDAVPNLIE